MSEPAVRVGSVWPRYRDGSSRHLCSLARIQTWLRSMALAQSNDVLTRTSGRFSSMRRAFPSIAAASLPIANHAAARISSTAARPARCDEPASAALRAINIVSSSKSSQWTRRLAPVGDVILCPCRMPPRRSESFSWKSFKFHVGRVAPFGYPRWSPEGVSGLTTSPLKLFSDRK